MVNPIYQKKAKPAFSLFLFSHFLPFLFTLVILLFIFFVFIILEKYA